MQIGRLDGASLQKQMTKPERSMRRRSEDQLALENLKPICVTVVNNLNPPRSPMKTQNREYFRRIE